jgi:hypothetical protein
VGHRAGHPGIGRPGVPSARHRSSSVVRSERAGTITVFPAFDETVSGLSPVCAVVRSPPTGKEDRAMLTVEAIQERPMPLLSTIKQG